MVKKDKRKTIFSTITFPVKGPSPLDMGKVTGSNPVLGKFLFIKIA